MINNIDLHGIKHDDVDRIVENFVLMNELPIRIITGNSDRMISLTKDVLDRHDFQYESFKSGQIIILKKA